MNVDRIETRTVAPGNKTQLDAAVAEDLEQTFVLPQRPREVWALAVVEGAPLGADFCLVAEGVPGVAQHHPPDLPDL